MSKFVCTINAVGEPTIAAEGFTGASCKEKSRPLEAAFEGGTVNTEEKPEMHMIEDEEQQLTEEI